MKKTSINLLCVLIIAILAGSILLPAAMASYYFVAGMLANAETTAEVAPQPDTVIDTSSLVVIAMQPGREKLAAPTDTIKFDDGREFPAVITSANIYVPDAEMQSNLDTVSLICTILSTICLILLIIELIKFMISINKGQIFNSLNVKRLRRFGIYLILIAAIECMSGLFQENSIVSMGLELEGYDITALWSIPWQHLLLGFLALLMSQVWAYGLSLKEEHELTI